VTVHYSSSYALELHTAISAARSAGSILQSYRTRDRLQIAEKADRSLVSAADLASEKEILTRLHASFPNDAILSEEAGETLGEGKRRWIVDPLDGTTNFSHRLPFSAVSIALWEGQVPIVAALYLPVLDELFTATADGPASLNGVEIRVSKTARVADAMINVYFDRHRYLQPGLDTFRRVATACEGRVKTMGSTASMLCYVACGRLDAFVRNSTRVWDFAAGKLVLERAGGKLTDFDEAPLTASDQSLLATNASLHEELAAVCRGG
jgi:myo-inositol-1(or 4)-monophosphatase